MPTATIRPAMPGSVSVKPADLASTSTTPYVTMPAMISDAIIGVRRWAYVIDRFFGDPLSPMMPA